MHWIGRILIGLILMAAGIALVAFAPQLTDMFDQSSKYTGYFRIAGMVAIVIGMLFVFGVLGSSGTQSIQLPH